MDNNWLCCVWDSEIAAEYNSLNFTVRTGVFTEVSLPTVPDEAECRERLMSELRRIHHLGWIDSKQLDSGRNISPCHAPQCGGFTLEAEFGIPKNSRSEPDFLGWEIKQHKVSSFARPFSGGAITLMTPEPTGVFILSMVLKNLFEPLVMRICEGDLTDSILGAFIPSVLANI